MTVATVEVRVRCTLGCDWTFDGAHEEAVESALWHREKVHAVAPASGPLPLNGGYGFTIEKAGRFAKDEGLAALERMDPGEPRRPALGEGDPGVDERPAGDVDAGSSSERCRTASEPSPSPSSQQPQEGETNMALCKIDGCDNYAAAQLGPYAKLCAAHADEKKAARHAGSQASAVPPPGRQDKRHHAGRDRRTRSPLRTSRRRAESGTGGLRPDARRLLQPSADRQGRVT